MSKKRRFPRKPSAPKIDTKVMQNEELITPATVAEEQPTPEIHVDANQLLYTFLKNNNLRLTVEVFEGENPYVGDGFILTDKPLLKIVAKYAVL